MLDEILFWGGAGFVLEMWFCMHRVRHWKNCVFQLERVISTLLQPRNPNEGNT